MLWGQDMLARQATLFWNVLTTISCLSALACGLYDGSQPLTALKQGTEFNYTTLTSKTVPKVLQGTSTSDKLLQLLNITQANRTSRPPTAEISPVLSKFPSGSGLKNLTQSLAQSNKSKIIPEKYSDSGGISKYENGNLLNNRLPTRNQTLSKTESKRNILNISSNADIRTTNYPKFNNDDISFCSLNENSCENRCSSATSNSCSCHRTCTLYGTCCEDIYEHCPFNVSNDSKMFEKLKTSTTQCRDGHFFVSSCPGEFSSSQWEIMKTWEGRQYTDHSENHSVNWWFQYVDTDINNTQLSRRCETTDLTLDLIHKVPVTDVATQVHFKNVFCAICHNISQVEFWVTLAICDAQSKPTIFDDVAKPTPFAVASETTWSASNSSSSIRRINADCQLSWVREEGQHACVSNPKQNIGATMARLHDFKADLSVTQGTLRNPIEEKVHLPEKRTQHSTPTDDNQLSQTTMKSIQDAGLPRPFSQLNCTTSELPTEGSILYTIRRVPPKPDPMVNPDWDVSVGEINTIMVDKFRLQVVRQPLVQTEITTINEGECSLKPIQLLMFTTFNFEKTGLLKGDFRMEVQKHIQVMMGIFETSESNETFCTAQKFNFSLTERSSHVFSIQVEMNCTDNPRNLDNSVNSSQNNASSENKENMLERYNQFVNARFNVLAGQEGAIGLPATIDYRTCVYAGLTSGKQPCTSCSRRSITWEIERNVNAIFGKISLEALISIICCVLSVIGLLSRLVLQRLIPFFNSYPGKVQFCLCMSLLIAYTFFLVGGAVVDGTQTCTVIGVITHLAFLSSLQWMNVTAFEIWRTFRHWSNQVMTRGTKSLILSAVYSVLIPVVIVTAALILDELWPLSEYSPYYGRPSCWINGTKAVAIFFVAPCSLVSFTNVIFIVLTLRGLRQQRTSISEFRKHKNNMAVTDTRIVVKIIFLVGITWLFGLLAALIDHYAFWIIFTILNASLGFFISLVLVFNRRVVATLKKNWQSYRTDSTLASTRTSVTKERLKAEPSV